MKRTPAIMFQGTGSDVGKSLIVAGLCRAFARRGLRVSPFKPQNMSNNAAVAEDGGEIGRAQALQARAARQPASVHMNPVLLKPEGGVGVQVVVQGKRWASLGAADYTARKAELMPAVLESFAVVSAAADLVLVEGAGSPAEVNLREGDIANMGFAEAANVAVALVGDIHRGGVIASLVGTHALLADGERQRVRGFVINKFRGDPALFAGGSKEIAGRTGWTMLGLVPWFAEAALLPAEDSVALERFRPGDGSLRIAVPLLPNIANFDDLDPLRQEPGVSVIPVREGEPLPVAELVLLPGSKATISDLAAFRARGWDTDIIAHCRRGGRVLGLCGGYQILGRRVSDRLGVEGPPGHALGLCLLDVDTELVADKQTIRVEGTHRASGTPIAGYEIHAGHTGGPDSARPFADIEGHPEGAQSADGRIAGSYVHGIFASDAFRKAFIESLGGKGSDLAFEARVEATLDRLGDHLEAALDIEAILAMARAGV